VTRPIDKSFSRQTTEENREDSPKGTTTIQEIDKGQEEMKIETIDMATTMRNEEKKR
jgi:hypothetical protein